MSSRCDRPNTRRHVAQRTNRETPHSILRHAQAPKPVVRWGHTNTTETHSNKLVVFVWAVPMQYVEAGLRGGDSVPAPMEVVAMGGTMCVEHVCAGGGGWQCWCQRPGHHAKALWPVRARPSRATSRGSLHVADQFACRCYWGGDGRCDYDS